MDTFPGNSHQSRITEKQPEAKAEGVSEPKKVRTVTTGKEKPKTLGARFRAMFVDDGTNFAEEIATNVVAPMVKEMIYAIGAQIGDGLKFGIEQMIFGPEGRKQDPRRRGTSFSTGRPVTNYGSYSYRRAEDRPPYGRREPIRRSNRLKDVIVGSRAEAQAVIDELQAKIDGYGHCTVGDYYSCVDIVPNSTDETWGWARIELDDYARVRKIDVDEYEIVMPPPRPIES